MRNLTNLDNYRDTSQRVIDIMGSTGDNENGVFLFPDRFVAGAIRVIASVGEGWDHVSVSLEDRCATWEEMDKIKTLFFKDDETAMQLHVPPSDHINCHPFCLHLWRPHDVEIPRPPAYMVGGRGMRIGFVAGTILARYINGIHKENKMSKPLNFEIDPPAPMVAAIALSLYTFNVAPLTRAKEIYEYFEGQCMEERDMVDMMISERGSLMTSFPYPTAKYYLHLALDMYREEAEQRVSVEELGGR